MIKQAQPEREREATLAPAALHELDGWRKRFLLFAVRPAPVPRCRHGPGVGLSESSDEGLRAPGPPCAAPALPTPAVFVSAVSTLALCGL